MAVHTWKVYYLRYYFPDDVYYAAVEEAFDKGLEVALTVLDTKA